MVRVGGVTADVVEPEAGNTAEYTHLEGQHATWSEQRHHLTQGGSGVGKVCQHIAVIDDIVAGGSRLEVLEVGWVNDRSGACGRNACPLDARFEAFHRKPAALCRGEKSSGSAPNLEQGRAGDTAPNPAGLQADRQIVERVTMGDVGVINRRFGRDGRRVDGATPTGATFVAIVP